ncbi:MAG: Y-family DNA polymerase [Phycisphaerales bacterium JB039]
MGRLPGVSLAALAPPPAISDEPFGLKKRERQRRTEAMLVVAPVGQRREVVGRCERAEGAGVRAGMTVSDARALLGAAPVRIVEHAPEREAAALAALARWAVRLVPRVAVDPPDGLLMDVTGCARLYGGEERLLSSVLGAVERLELCARGAIAPTFGAAWAVARYGECMCKEAWSRGRGGRSRRSSRGGSPHPSPLPRGAGEGAGGAGQVRVRGGRGAWIVPEASLREALAGLPTCALRIEEDVCAGLAEVGVERIGELLALPRGALPSRFGAELPLRIAQALGEAIETIEPVRPPAPLRAERLFDGPTSRWEAIELAARGLVRDLCAQLASRERGAMRLELVLERSDAPPVSLEFQLAGPSRERRHLWSLLRPKLERANLGFGVERMELVARASAPIAHRQSQRWRDDGAESRQRERQLAELIDGLSSRLGAQRVLRAEIVESHMPERAQRLIPALRQRRRGVASQVASGDRPTMLLAQPEPVRVMTVAPDGPVLRVRWRSEELRIETSVGPERIGGEWWRGREPERDYFKLQDARGRWLWVFRQRIQKQKAEKQNAEKQNAEAAEETQRSQSWVGFGPAPSEPEGLIESSRGWSATPAGWSDTPGSDEEDDSTLKGSSKRPSSSIHEPAARAAAPSRSPGQGPVFEMGQGRRGRRADLGGGWFVHGLWA